MENLRVVNLKPSENVYTASFLTPPEDENEVVVFTSSVKREVIPVCITFECRMSTLPGEINTVTMILKTLRDPQEDYTICRRQLQEIHALNPGKLTRLLGLLTTSIQDMALTPMGISLLNEFAQETQRSVPSLNH